MAIIINPSVATLIRSYNLQNVRVADTRNNPYEGNISQVTQQDKELYKSMLGTPVMADLTFKGERYINHRGQTVTFEDVRLETVLINVSQPKRIIKTEVQGRNGTVKELISQDDSQVTINGIITGSNGHHPADEIIALKNVLNAEIAIEVVSRYLQNLDIYNLVVENWDMVQDPGGYSYQRFTINCISDVPIELQMF